MIQLEIAFKHAVVFSYLDNKVLSWGDNASGRLGREETSTTRSSTINSSKLTSPREILFINKLGKNTLWKNERVVKVCAKGGHNLFLTSENRVFGNGYNGFGQLLKTPEEELGGTRYPYELDPQLSKNGPIKDLKGCYNSFVIYHGGMICGFGKNHNGQLALEETGKPADMKSISQIKFFRRSKIIVKDVIVGEAMTMFLTEGGFVYSTGYNIHGSLGLGHRENKSVPTRIESLSNIQEVSCGRYHSLFLKTGGKVFGCGQNGSHELGTFLNHKVAAEKVVLFPEHIAMPLPVLKVSCGFSVSFFLTSVGWYSCGKNANSQTGHFSKSDTAIITLNGGGIGADCIQVPTLLKNSLMFTQIKGGLQNTVALCNRGFLYSNQRIDLENHDEGNLVGGTAFRRIPKIKLTSNLPLFWRKKLFEQVERKSYPNIAIICAVY